VDDEIAYTCGDPASVPEVTVYIISPSLNSSEFVQLTWRVVALTLSLLSGETGSKVGKLISYVIFVFCALDIFPARSVPDTVRLYIDPSTSASTS